MKQPIVLGVWDGHDAGAALLQGDQVLFAVNEERLTRRKLEVGFPYRSIAACLKHTRLETSDIEDVAVSTSDPAKTLTRMCPGLKENYYLLRRRKTDPGALDGLKKAFKYRFTEFSPNPLSRMISEFYLKRELRRAGFCHYRLHLVDHHRGHAEAAARCSGFDECLVLTLDGVGDGLCGSLWTFQDDQLILLKELPARLSAGIFFEYVTHLMNMRELEDEGKVMALANYACPVPDADNPLLRIFRSDGTGFVSDIRPAHMLREMKKIFWRYPSEQFAYMAQQALEKSVLKLMQTALLQTGMNQLAVAGGVFSNIKLNMQAAESPAVDQLYVFPHMGDGGLALGSAMHVNYQQHGVSHYPVSHLYLGPEYDVDTIRRCIQHRRLPFQAYDDIARKAAELIVQGEILFWFQGRAELGPRALGNRSILARADDAHLKDRLNLVLKKRVWYQPFCPSLLLEDASNLLHTEKQPAVCNPFMTSAFTVRAEHRSTMAGVINIDGTCRPQFVSEENPRYRDLLLHIKDVSGYGVVLNTSFNIHGEPMVCSPDDALETFMRTPVRYLVMENFLITRNTPLPE